MGLGTVELLLVVAAAALALLLLAFSRGAAAQAGVVALLLAVAAFVTPADPRSMLLLGLPVCGLYLLCMYGWRSRRPTE